MVKALKLLWNVKLACVSTCGEGKKLFPQISHKCVNASNTN